MSPRNRTERSNLFAPPGFSVQSEGRLRLLERSARARPGGFPMSVVRVFAASLILLTPALAGAAEVRGKIEQVDAEQNALRLDAGRGRDGWIYLQPSAPVVWRNQEAGRTDLVVG